MKKLRLLVPLATIATVLLLLIAPAGALAASDQTMSAGSSCVQWHYVQCGQTLASIARMYGTSVAYLAAINGIANPNVIYAGQSLCVRRSAPPPPPCGGFWYMVKCGDTLNKIGARYGWSAAYLAQVNHLCNPNVIYVGQRLWIPGHGCCYAAGC